MFYIIFFQIAEFDWLPGQHKETINGLNVKHYIMLMALLAFT